MKTIQNMINILQPYSIYIILGLSLLVLILIIYVINVNSKVKKMIKKYENFMHGSSGENVEAILNEWVSKLNMLEVEKNQLKHDLRKLDQNQELCIQKVNVMRYNPFENMGGDLCFVMTLLNAKNDGIILNGIHNREGSYIYAKKVENGKCNYKLSDEEVESLQKAM